MTGTAVRRGRVGEEIATHFLEKGGFKILERNYRTEFGEVDIIATEGQTLVFIEVKAVRCSGFGAPEERVDGRKQRRIAKVALAYLQRHQLSDVSCRFDVVVVDQRGERDRIEHIPNAFQLDSF